MSKRIREIRERLEVVKTFVLILLLALLVVTAALWMFDVVAKAGMCQ